MATRSTIWIKKEDGLYDGIYCHWDGYMSHNGKILYEQYNTIELAKELISFGNMSQLANIVSHCKFYHRDRNQDFKMYKDFTFEEIENVFEEYNYFFIDGKWKFISYRGKLKNITKRLLEEEE